MIYLLQHGILQRLDNTIQVLEHFLKDKLGQGTAIKKFGYNMVSDQGDTKQGTVLVEFPQENNQTRLFVGGIPIR